MDETNKKDTTVKVESKNTYQYPSTGIVKRTTLGSAFNVMGEVILALRQIILVPLFLLAWGDVLYGEWLILFSFVAYFSLAGLGTETFVGNRLIQFSASGNIKEYKKIFASTFVLYSGITLTLMGALIVAVYVFPFQEWLNITHSSLNTVRAALLLLGAYALLKIITGLIQSLYGSFGEYPRAVFITNMQEVVLTLFLVITLLLKGNVVLISAGFLTTLILFSVFILYDIKRRRRELKFSFSDADWHTAREIIPKGLLFLMIPVALVISTQGSIILIATLLGPGLVAVFSIHRALANLIIKFTNALRHSVGPEITALESRKNYSVTQIIHNFLIKLTLTVSISAAVILFFTGENIINIWTGGNIVFQPTLWYLLLISLPISTLWLVSASFQVAINRYKRYAIVRIVSALIGLVLAFLLGKQWGIAGIFLGFMIPEIMLNAWIIPQKTCQIINENIWKFWMSVTRSIPLIMIELLVGWLIFQSIHGVWTQLLAEGITLAIIGIVFLYTIWLDDEEKKIIKRVIKRLRRR